MLVTVDSSESRATIDINLAIDNIVASAKMEWAPRGASTDHQMAVSSATSVRSTRARAEVALEVEAQGLQETTKGQDTKPHTQCGRANARQRRCLLATSYRALLSDRREYSCIRLSILVK
jgi:hypothetical protein